MWLTGGPWSWGKRTAFSGGHRRWGTSPVLHGTAVLRRPEHSKRETFTLDCNHCFTWVKQRTLTARNSTFHSAVNDSRINEAVKIKYLLHYRFVCLYWCEGANAGIHSAIMLTPFRMTSLLSLHFIKRTIFQLVLQFTEFTWVGNENRIVSIFNMRLNCQALLANRPC